jgi:hypothetical protein
MAQSHTSLCLSPGATSSGSNQWLGGPRLKRQMNGIWEDRVGKKCSAHAIMYRTPFLEAGKRISSLAGARYRHASSRALWRLSAVVAEIAGLVPQ